MVLQSKGRMSRLKYLTVLKSKIRRTSSLSSPSSSTSKTQPPRSDSPPISVYSKSSLPSDGLSQRRANDKLKTLVEERDEDHAKAKEEVKVEVVDDVKLKRESTEEHTSIKAKVIRSSAEAEHVTMIKDSLSDSQLRAKNGLKPLREERDEDHTKEEVAVDDVKREGTEDHTSIEAKVMRSLAKAVAVARIQKSLSKIKESFNAMQENEMMHDDVQTVLTRDIPKALSEIKVSVSDYVEGLFKPLGRQSGEDSVSGYSNESDDTIMCHTKLGEVLGDVFSILSCLKNLKLKGVPLCDGPATVNEGGTSPAESKLNIYWGTQIPDDDNTLTSHVSNKSLVIYSNTPGDIETHLRSKELESFDDDGHVMTAHANKKMYEEIMQKRGFLTHAFVQCDDFFSQLFCCEERQDIANDRIEKEEWNAYYDNCHRFLYQDSDDFTSEDVFIAWLNLQEEQVKAGKSLSEFRVSVFCITKILPSKDDLPL